MKETIPETFTYNGFIFTFLFREGKVALYEQKMANNEAIHCYEVHCIRTSKGIERLCPTTDFGKFGWSFHKLNNAKKKMKELLS